MYNSFRDKIVQHSLCDNVLEPVLSKTFIYDNYASQKGKGTHFGLDRLKLFMQKFYRQHGTDGWVLKCDVRKYFYRIDHDVLKSQLRRLIKDTDVLWLLDMIIDSTEGPGIPIGNHTSQWFAVLYLSGMDHMIKERLGIKFYGRYTSAYKTATGKNCKAGKAKITAIAAGKAHPYHLVAVSGKGSTVYGWVDAADVSVAADQTIKKGDKVKVLKAQTYNGGTFKTYYDVYDVIQVNGDRVVIGIGKTVTAAVKASNLQKV